MKRILFVATLAAVLVFAFSGVAMAKYAGYGYNIDGDAHVGYLSWDGALLLNPDQADDPGGPHGGYTANTVKCAVCHSVHRAASDQEEAGVGSYWKLTPGGESCVACHTATGSNPSDLLVEWPSVYDDGGPHRGFQCMGQCHAGVHGGIASEYAAAAKFLLNPNRREGTTGGYGGMDDGITNALAAGNVRTGIVDEVTLDEDWSVMNDTQRASNRAMVTGYLCGQAGCHTASQFAVNTHGYAEGRTLPPDATDGPYDQFFTGHRTANNTQHCGTGGCHQFVGDMADSTCATCHDFMGVVTGTSAWPHANRGIDVYEWVRETDGILEVVETPVERNNLWMYTGDVTFRDAEGEPTSTVMWDGQEGVGVTHGSEVLGYAPNRINTRTVLEGNASFNETEGIPGNIQDGVCLKCHGFKYWPVHAGDPDRSFAEK